MKDVSAGCYYTRYNRNKKSYIKNLPEPEIEGATNYRIMLHVFSLTSFTK